MVVGVAFSLLFLLSPFTRFVRMLRSAEGAMPIRLRSCQRETLARD